jgi:hypothetical protein
MNIELQAQKITDKYIANGADMNSSIAKVASDLSLNIEETKRLVEECNKTCYLTKFASTGEQTFDIADYQKVKSILQSEGIVEKKASLEFEKVDYFKDNAYGLDSLNESLEKVASENDLLNQAIDKCDEDISYAMTKIAQLRSSFMPLENIEIFEKNAEEARLIKSYLIEKRASLSSAVLNEVGKVGGAALIGSAKVGGVVVKHPVRAGLIPLGVIGSYKEGSKKVAKENAPMIGNVNIDPTLNKEDSSVGEIFKDALPYAKAMGMIGMGAAAAKGAGGLVSKMMQTRKLNESFQTIQKNNEDIRQIPNARDYFDVVARHSPDLAMDPMVAPQLIRQFDMFGGVDINTVGKLREMQNDGPMRNNSDNFAKDFLGGMGALQGTQYTNLKIQQSRKLLSKP